jgi:hypothetical protein
VLNAIGIATAIKNNSASGRRQRGNWVACAKGIGSDIILQYAQSEIRDIAQTHSSYAIGAQAAFRSIKALRINIDGKPDITFDLDLSQPI